MVDTSGNLYVTDRGNHTVRKIAPDGVVTTLAGTPGQSATIAGLNSGDGVGGAARFNVLTGITVDGFGNVYVGDTVMDEGRIRRIGPDGAVTSLVGDIYSLGLTTDGAGNLYVAAQGRGSLVGTLRIAPDNSVTTIAPTLGRAIALNRNGNIFISDTGLDFGPLGNTGSTCRIAAYSAAGTPIAGFVGRTAGLNESTCGYADGQGEAARLSTSDGMTMDAQGNLYIADTGNHVIRRVTPTGAVTTIAGTAGSAGSANGTGATARFNRPQGITVDAAGDLYVADTGNHMIRKITAAGVVTTISGAAALPGSTDVPSVQVTTPTTAATQTQGIPLFSIPAAYRNKTAGTVYQTALGCSYFIVDTLSAYSVLQHFGGAMPSRGDVLVGDLNTYTFTDYFNRTTGSEGRAWVDSALLSLSRAIEITSSRCPLAAGFSPSLSSSITSTVSSITSGSSSSGRCNVPSDRASDGSRCGGRAASER